MQKSRESFQPEMIVKGKALRRSASATGRIRQQDRALSTRHDLMNAARCIFARDGFEMARLEDIAAAAGKTRGAFYANFRDKEDVFFALYEEAMLREKQQMGEQLSAAGSDDERIEIMTKHLRSVLGDRRRMLLALEFKLYAIRHPKRTKRLAELHAAVCRRCIEANVEKVIPGYAGLTETQKRRKTAQIGALLDGIALNRMFDCHGLTDDLIERHLRAALRIVFVED
jgi:AcrR family transcriptional regulator